MKGALNMDGLDHKGHPRRSWWGAFYAFATVMGVLYVTDVTQTRALAGATDGVAALTWQWTLLAGGLVGLVGNLTPRAHYKWALTVEVVGAMSTVMAVTIYVAFVTFAPATSGVPWMTVTSLAAIALALAGRAFEAMAARGRALEHEKAREIARLARQSMNGRDS